MLRFLHKEERDNYINGVKFTHHNFKGKFEKPASHLTSGLLSNKM